MRSSKWFKVIGIAGLFLVLGACSSDDDGPQLPGFTDLPPDEVEPFLEETVLPVVSQLFFLFESGPLAAVQEVSAGTLDPDSAEAGVSPQEGCDVESCPGGGFFEVCELGPTGVELIFEQCTEGGETVDGVIAIGATGVSSAIATFNLTLSSGAELRGSIGVAIDELSGCLTVGFEDFLATAQGETLVFAGAVTGCEGGFPEGTLRITVVSTERGTFYIDINYGGDGSAGAIVYDANGAILYTCDVNVVAGSAECSEAA